MGNNQETGTPTLVEGGVYRLKLSSILIPSPATCRENRGEQEIFKSGVPTGYPQTFTTDEIEDDELIYLRSLVKGHGEPNLGSLLEQTADLTQTVESLLKRIEQIEFTPAVYEYWGY